MTRDEAAKELATLCKDLGLLYGELAAVEMGIADNKQQSYEYSTAQSVAGITLAIEIDSTDLRKEAIDLRASIRIAEERRDHLRFALKHGLEQHG